MVQGVCNTGESSGSYLECEGNHWRAGQGGDASGPAFYEASGASGAWGRRTADVEGGSTGDLAGSPGSEEPTGVPTRCWWRSGGVRSPLGQGGAFAGRWARCRSSRCVDRPSCVQQRHILNPTSQDRLWPGVWLGQGASQVFKFSSPVISNVCQPCAMNARVHLYRLEHTREERPPQVVTSGGPSQPVLVTDI